MRNKLIEVFILLSFISSALFMPMAALAVEETDGTEPPAITAETVDEVIEAIEVIETDPDETDYMDYTGGLDEDDLGSFMSMLSLLSMLGAANAEPGEPEIPYEPIPFTPNGQATVTDQATENDGKEFYTFSTPAGNVFYLIIDHARANDNVYFLNAVTESDLAALAEQASKPTNGGAATMTGRPVTYDEKPVEDEQIKPIEKETPPNDNNGGNNNTIIFVVIAVIALGGAGYYIKIVRPKHQATDIDDDEDEPEGDDDDIPYEDESEVTGNGDDGDYDAHDDGDIGESGNEEGYEED